MVLLKIRFFPRVVTRKVSQAQDLVNLATRVVELETCLWGGRFHSRSGATFLVRDFS